MTNCAAGWAVDTDHFLLRNLSSQLVALEQASQGHGEEPIHPELAEQLQWVRDMLRLERNGTEPRLATELLRRSDDVAARVQALWRTPSREQLDSQLKLVRAEIAKLRPLMATSWPEARSEAGSKRWSSLARALGWRVRQFEALTGELCR